MVVTEVLYLFGGSLFAGGVRDGLEISCYELDGCFSIFW